MAMPVSVNGEFSVVAAGAPANWYCTRDPVRSRMPPIGFVAGRSILSSHVCARLFGSWPSRPPPCPPPPPPGPPPPPCPPPPPWPPPPPCPPPPPPCGPWPPPPPPPP